MSLALNIQHPSLHLFLIEIVRSVQTSGNPFLEILPKHCILNLGEGQL